MPGSKTYTSNKINELLESEFLGDFLELEKHNAKTVSNAFFGEVLKISLSLLIAAVVKLFDAKAALSSAPVTAATSLSAAPTDEVYTIIYLCAVFMLSYFLIHCIIIGGKWLFDSVFNKRILASQKAKAYITFHKKVENYIYLGISFENKYNSYISRRNFLKKEIFCDLAANYLSQSAHYFELAKDELYKLIPEKVEKRNKSFDQKNAQYLYFIGFPSIIIALVSAQRSLNRLLNTEDAIIAAANGIKVLAKQSHIQCSYVASLHSMLSDIRSYVSFYQNLLERVYDLQILFQSENNSHGDQ